MTSNPTERRRQETANEDGSVGRRESAAALFALMAHSLLNSVATIKTASVMLDDRDGLNDQQIDTVVDVITTQADHLYEMVKDLVRTGDPALMYTLAEPNPRTQLDAVPA